MTTRKFNPTEVEFTLRCEAEDIPVRGNAIASGDDDVDRKYEDKIIADREAGDPWAWCCVTVEARWAGFVGRDVLGGCSYANEEGFRQRDGYFGDMLREAVNDLIVKIQEAGWKVDASEADLLAAESHGFEHIEVVYP